MPDDDGLRVELIQRLCRVPAENLPEIQRFLAQLGAAATGRAVVLPAAEPMRPLRDWPHRQAERRRYSRKPPGAL